MAPNTIPSVSIDSNLLQLPQEQTAEFTRDEIFTKWQKPFGIPAHIIQALVIIPAHFLVVYYSYLTWKNETPRSVILFEIFCFYLGLLGITVGSHRYWSHKTFRATLPLQYLLMGMQTMGFQYPIHKWCLDHRIHHKYTDTDADPHNSKRGFWYAHIGWLFVPRTKEHLKQLKTFRLPDLEKDPVVRFQSKYWASLVIVLHFAIPMAITFYFWEMSLFLSLCSVLQRQLAIMHVMGNANSFAHMFGDRPYDKSLTASENAIVSILNGGDGWHNYHHTFPWDYKSSEFGAWRKLNLATLFINFFASIGWAYDLKTVSQKLLKERLKRTGDGSHDKYVDAYEDENDPKQPINDFDYSTPSNVTELMKTMDKPIWGWDDSTMPQDLRNVTKILRSVE